MQPQALARGVRPPTGPRATRGAAYRAPPRGPNITPGYVNQPEVTAEAIDAAGWLHTGDIGVLDNEGYLRITGRKKDFINTASGKTCVPQLARVLETRIGGLTCGNVRSTVDATCV